MDFRGRAETEAGLPWMEYVSRSVTLRKQKSAYDCMRKSGRVIMARQAGWHRRIIIILSQHLAGAGFFYCLILE
ncbi:MAG: hypothetical protein PHR18_05660, partial [Oscillospiraceae bacterium]|nr:hypothetical protein [Oscillospiraceae bacterium]